MDIKDKIKERRIELGLTMLDVAKAVGVSEATVSRWESGNIENMKRDKIVLLAKALKVSPSYIMGWEDDYSEKNDDIDRVFLSLAKEAKENQIDPEDIRAAIKMIKELRKKDR